MALVSVAECRTYDPEGVRYALERALAPLGGIGRFVRPGMRVLLKPNLVSSAPLEQAVTTHPALVRAVAEMVREAGGEVWIGDSPAGPAGREVRLWRRTGMADVAEATGARLVPFERPVWRGVDGRDYAIAAPVLEADLVLSLPKLKTHTLTLYTGAVKNLLGTVPGTRKREIHFRAPGLPEFSRALADVLALVRPRLTLLDGVWGQEGNGPGSGGTPRLYGCLVASEDPVAMDTVLARAMGCRPGDVLHVEEAAARGLGVGDPARIQVVGGVRALDFGPVRLPGVHRWLRFSVPRWLAAPLRRVTRRRPQLKNPAACIGCGQCVEACPREAIVSGKPPRFDLERCIGCMCCAEICPQGILVPRWGPLARIFGVVE
ncbi:MAG: DUF362 domain-containing protein [Thermoflexia bacterium]|nr:MAG: DUF362 domain-containing protein [Thermoflexia bacterium]